MAYISSRKRAVRPLSGSAFSAPAATLIAGLTLATPFAQAQTASQTLPTVNVQTSDDAGSAGYKADSVSSPKFTQPLVDTPQTISVIKEEVIKEQSATTLTEALKNVPGVGTFFLGENGSTSTGDAIYMRGFDSSSSIYVDGIRDLGTISRDVFNIDQVEVTKGPAGTDYGRSAPTGAINLVTKQPKLEDSFDASLGFGSGSYKRTTVDWNKKLEGFESGAAFRVNVVGEDSGVAGRDEVKNKRWGIAPSLAFGLNTATRVYLDFLHVKQDNVPDGGVFTIGLPGYSAPDGRAFLNSAAKVNSSNFYGTSSDHDDVTADMATVKVEHDFSANTKLRNTTRWGRTKQNYLLTAFMGASTGNSILTPNPADPSTWTLARLINTKDIVNTIYTNQTNLTTSFNTGSIRHDLSTGIELTREEQTSYTLAAAGTVPTRVSVYSPDSSVSLPAYNRTGADSEGATNTYAIYAFDTLHLSDRWDLNGGLRIDHYNTDYSTHSATGATTLALTKSGNLFNWKIGPVFKPAPNGSIYADYAVSQQPPGGTNFTLAAANPTTTRGAADSTSFDPQKAKTFEIGTKWEVLDKRLLLTGALFQTTVENEVMTDADGRISQEGEKRVRGLELGAVGQITPAWAVTAGYTIQNAKVEQGANVSQDGSDTLSYTPKDAFTLWSTYRLPFGLTVGGGAYYSGGLKRGTDGAVGTPAFTDSYWVFNAMASYQLTKNLSLQFNVFNLFDKDYVASINKSGYRYTPGVERSYRLTANLQF